MIQYRNVYFCIAAAILTIVLGLALRRYGYDLGLPFPIVKYGGSVLWGTMVYFFVATALTKFPDRFVLGLALLIAVLVELFRLYHTPELDSFRVTTAGALLLGRVFSIWNIVAYACGICAAFLAMRAATRR